MVPEIFTVRDYYRDPLGHDADKKPLQRDAWFAYDSVMTGDYEAATNTLRRWLIQCKGVAGNEGQLVMVHTGHLLLEVYLELVTRGWADGGMAVVMADWTRDIFMPCVWVNIEENNNQGAWALLGLTLCNAILSSGCEPEIREVYYRIVNKAIGDNGVMQIEVKRSNSGMWYSYFALAPLFRVAYLTSYVDINRLYPSLLWLWQYCQYPETWPYKLAPWWSPKGMWQRLFHPCAREVELPKRNDWPANLYKVAGDFFNVKEWSEWGQPWPGPALYPGCNIFRFGR